MQLVTVTNRSACVLGPVASCSVLRVQAAIRSDAVSAERTSLLMAMERHARAGAACIGSSLARIEYCNPAMPTSCTAPGAEA